MPHYVAACAFCQCTTGVANLALVVPVPFPVWVESVCDAVPCYEVSRRGIVCVFVPFCLCGGFVCDLCWCGVTYLCPGSLCQPTCPGRGRREWGGWVEGRARVVVVPGLLSVGVCVSTGKVRLDPTVGFVRSVLRLDDLIMY